MEVNFSFDYSENSIHPIHNSIMNLVSIRLDKGLVFQKYYEVGGYYKASDLTDAAEKVFSALKSMSGIPSTLTQKNLKAWMEQNSHDVMQTANGKNLGGGCFRDISHLILALGYLEVFRKLPKK